MTTDLVRRGREKANVSRDFADLFSSFGRRTGGYTKFLSEGWNENYLPVWLQEAGYDTYYTGKLMNGLSTTTYNNPFPKGWNRTDCESCLPTSLDHHPGSRKGGPGTDTNLTSLRTGQKSSSTQTRISTTTSPSERTKGPTRLTRASTRRTWPCRAGWTTSTPRSRGPERGPSLSASRPLRRTRRPSRAASTRPSPRTGTRTCSRTRRCRGEPTSTLTRCVVKLPVTRRLCRHDRQTS